MTKAMGLCTFSKNHGNKMCSEGHKNDENKNLEMLNVSYYHSSTGIVTGFRLGLDS
jgi:hypothetical protein